MGNPFPLLFLLPSQATQPNPWGPFRLNAADNLCAPFLIDVCSADRRGFADLPLHPQFASFPIEGPIRRPERGGVNGSR
jgi:hypothetical protein